MTGFSGLIRTGSNSPRHYIYANETKMAFDDVFKISSEDIAMAHTYYESGDIIVDDGFARFGRKSYAINKINSVEVRSFRKGTDFGWGLCALLAFIGLMSLIGGGGTGAIVVAVIFGALAYFLRKASHNQTHSLILMTSSSEVQALQSDDEDQILSLRHAVESAMVA